MSITGASPELANLAKALKFLGTDVIPKASKTMAAEVGAAYKEEFSSDVGPFGDTWAPNKAGTRIGYRTGALAGAAPTLSAGTVRILPPKYWSYFQAGAPGGANPRAVLPFGPSNWDDRVQSKVKATIETYFNGLGAK